jgi:hypothetical protein
VLLTNGAGVRLVVDGRLFVVVLKQPNEREKRGSRDGTGWNRVNCHPLSLSSSLAHTRATCDKSVGVSIFVLKKAFCSSLFSGETFLPDLFRITEQG